ncbi:MAG: tRNA-dihydrouridine synthase [Deltaproteobacteria bacterium]|nr:tRNA-dihydrouridine synthase [Deltaproteobacteria bacterium]
MIQWFWNHLPRPILGLAPMDGVTNAPFRAITARYGRPDVIFTEFVPIDGLMHRATRLLTDLVYAESERPVVAQIYGNDPGGCYAIAHLVCELGFDGLDINMGCPARNVASRGAGAGLIRTPQIAQAMIRAAQRGITDWSHGQTLLQAGVPTAIVEAAATIFRQRPERRCDRREPIPVSVKTRLGYDTAVVRDWIATLLEAAPVVISLHGRTLTQMYRGEADWDAIAMAAEIVHQTSTLVLGNGDLGEASIMEQRLRETNVDGLLVGRAAIGNPWIFRMAPWLRRRMAGDATAAAVPPPDARSPDEALAVFVEHAEAIEAAVHPKAFTQLFRFVKPYTQGLPNANVLRTECYQIRSAAELKRLVRRCQRHHDAACTVSSRVVCQGRLEK